MSDYLYRIGYDEDKEKEEVDTNEECLGDLTRRLQTLMSQYNESTSNEFLNDMLYCNFGDVSRETFRDIASVQPMSGSVLESFYTDEDKS